MKKNIISGEVVKITSENDLVFVHYRRMTKGVIETITFDYDYAGPQLEKLKRKYRFRWFKPTLTLTSVHGEFIKAVFDDTIEFNSDMTLINALEKKSKELSADFKDLFDAYLKNVHAEPADKLLISIYSLPLLLRYWPAVLLHRFKKDPKALKRLTVLVKLLKIVNKLKPFERFDPYKIRLSLFDTKFMEGCDHDWDEVLLYRDENPDVCNFWDCFSEDSEVRKELEKEGLCASAQKYQLVINYFDYLTRLMKFTYEQDIEIFEKNISYDSGHFLSPDKRVRTDEEELKQIVKKLTLFRLPSDFLLGNRLTSDEISALIRIIKL